MPASAGSYMTLRSIQSSIQNLTRQANHPTLVRSFFSSNSSSLSLHSVTSSLVRQPRLSSPFAINALVPSTRFYSAETQGYKFKLVYIVS